MMTMRGRPSLKRTRTTMAWGGDPDVRERRRGGVLGKEKGEEEEGEEEGRRDDGDRNDGCRKRERRVDVGGEIWRRGMEMMTMLKMNPGRRIMAMGSKGML